MDALQKKESEQKKRKDEALKHANKIANIIFHKSIDTNIQYTENMWEGIIPTPFFIATVTIQTGLELSTEAFLEPEGYKIGEYAFSHSVGFKSISFLDDKVSIDNFILQLKSLFENKILGLVFSFDFETDDFSITVSSNGYNSLDFTFKFTNPDNDAIFYEINFKIEMRNPKLVEALVEAQEFLVEAAENIGVFLYKYPLYIPLIVFALAVVTFVSATTAAPTATIATVAASFAPVIEFIRNALQYPIIPYAEKIFVTGL